MARTYKKREHSMGASERKTFTSLKGFNPKACRSARAWVMAVIAQDPTITKTVYDALVVLWGLKGVRGYGDAAWWAAVARWRKDNGLPPLGGGRPHWRRSANWMPGDSEPGDNGVPVGSKPVSEDQAVAELVLEWMESKGFYTVQFHSDGRVQCYRSVKKRVFNLSIEDIAQ